MPLTEKQIESQILDWLNLQPGIFAFKVNTTGVYDTARKCFRTIKNPHIHKGTSDIIGCKNGLFFAIEVKSPGQWKTVARCLHQKEFHKAIVMKKGQACFVYGLEQVIQFMKSMD
jgi:hypothetical protein